MEVSSEDTAFEVKGCEHLEDTVYYASTHCPRTHPYGINVKPWLNIYEGNGQSPNTKRPTGLPVGVVLFNCSPVTQIWLPSFSDKKLKWGAVLSNVIKLLYSRAEIQTCSILKHISSVMLYQ